MDDRQQDFAFSQPMAVIPDEAESALDENEGLAEEPMAAEAPNQRNGFLQKQPYFFLLGAAGAGYILGRSLAGRLRRNRML